ncbi:MAG: cell wall hydrolase [Desulfotomaculales bacterium]
MGRDGTRFWSYVRSAVARNRLATARAVELVRRALRAIPFRDWLRAGLRRPWPALAFLVVAFLTGLLLNRYPLLVPGTRGPEVREVHQFLAVRGLYHEPVGDLYTLVTVRAVRDFQRANRLPAHGLVGPATWEALHRRLPTPPEAGPAAASRSGVSDRDTVLLLAHLVAGEAADEPFAGKVAVAAVALNRTRHPAFPATVPGVIFQLDAFESVHNGQFYRPVTAEDVRAAELALQGWDPSGGALYFWNPEKPVNPWIWSRPVVTQIGGHVFAR